MSIVLGSKLTWKTKKRMRCLERRRGGGKRTKRYCNIRKKILTVSMKKGGADR